MFPRNNATPPAIDLGQILLLADGTIQTTGASVRVRIGTGAWGAGAGTLACDTTSGIWTYAPTQAETNAEYFIVGAYKADCSALSKTVITSDSTTSGRVYVATNGDKTGYSLTVAPLTASETASAVWDALVASYTVNNSFGARVIRSTNNNQNTVDVTASNHVAANIHALQTGVITASDFAAGAIDATVLAADCIGSSQLSASAVTEIQSGLATTTQLTTVEAVTDKLGTTVELDGAVYRFTTNALEQGPSGAGSTSIVVTPVVAQTPVRATATTITTYKGDRSAITVGVFSGTTPVNLSTLGALEVCIQTKAGTDLQLIAAANITISGTSSNYFSFSPSSTAVGTVGRFMWSLRVAASGSKQVIVYGAFVVEDAALAD